MAFQKGVGVVLPLGRVRKQHSVYDQITRRVAVLVDLAQVMEHTHNVGRTRLTPDQVIVLSQRQEVLRDHVGVFQKTALIIAVVLGGSRGGEEAVGHQVLHQVIRNNRGSVRQLHEVQKISHFGL